MNKPEKPALSRRGFFGRLATIAGAAGAAVLMRPQAASAGKTGGEAPAATPKRGYEETAHVRKYYDKARF